jgi:hypothetical protein
MYQKVNTTPLWYLIYEELTTTRDYTAINKLNIDWSYLTFLSVFKI